MKRTNTHVTGDCRAVSDVLARIGDKWSVLIVSRLGARSMRFNEIRRDIGNISQRMLTLTLRGLERDGLVLRTVFATIPPRVDYALTPLGRSLLVPVRALGEWAIRHHTEIADARTVFDSQNGSEKALASQPSPSRSATSRADERVRIPGSARA